MSLTFVTSASTTVGTPVHVSVYEGGVALIPSSNTVTWSALPAAGLTVTPDNTGYLLSFAAPSGAGATFAVTATQGVFSGVLQVMVTAPLLFTTP